MFKKNVWKEMLEVKDKELDSVKEDVNQLTRSIKRKDAINERKDKLIDSLKERVEELERTAKNVQITGGRLVGTMTKVLGQNQK